ncbi:MAG: MFS transporter [Gammaproteobacteria bacterium]|nr:MFS transporter [Gammaproteobacteria bacterium]
MRVNYWRLSQFYFFYFASLGVLVPFWSLYLDHLHFSALEIGQLISTLAISKIIAPYIWGWIADHTGYHIRIVQITSLFSVVCFAPLLYVDSFWWMLLFMFLFSFFWNASLPQFEVVTLAQLGKEKFRYSQIRLWGSLGFIAAVTILGALFVRVSIEWLPSFLIGVFTLIWLSSLPVKEYRQHDRSVSHILSVLRTPQVIALLLSCFFMQASHGPYYTFYSLFMEGLEYSRFSIGLLWSLGVLAEVVLFLFMFRLLKYKPASYWLALALVLTTVRWLLMAWYSEIIVLVIITQCLHAASFGMFHAAAIHLIHDFFPQHRGRGQALYASVSFGAGGAVGSLYAGSLWERYSPSLTFTAAALIALVGFLVALMVRNHPAESKGWGSA